ncbi:MAG: hypothetical protein ACYC7E_18390 [Armatimonadota bacterium]
MRRSVLILGAVLGLFVLFPSIAWAQDAPAATPPNPPAAGAMSPQMHAQMMRCAQEMSVMMQNTAVWTPQGLYILQGNRLLQYGTDLRLIRQAILPAPPAATTTAAPPAGGTTPTPSAASVPAFSSMVPPQILPTEGGGLVVVRGQQVLRLSQDLRVLNSATLPTLPPMTTAEMQATCPLCQCMQMMAGMMGTMGAAHAGAGGTAGMDGTMTPTAAVEAAAKKVGDTPEKK